MTKKVKARGTVELPTGVHRVVSRGRLYIYWHPFRGTKTAGKPIRLPNDTLSPDFWTALQQAQGMAGDVGVLSVESVGGLIDAFIRDWPHLRRKIAKSTQKKYEYDFNRAKAMWSAMAAKNLRPMHVQHAMDKMSDTPGAANNLLGAMQALSKWALRKGYIESSLTEGVEAYEKDGGHIPWTDEQIKCAHEHLTGDVRKGVFLLMYTGQRGSDMVRLAPTMIDNNDGHLGFDLGFFGQRKTNVRPWMPIVPELQKEMDTWEKRPGPYVRNKEGGKCSRARFTKFFRDAVDALAAKGITALEGATLHGLRGTCCIRLKRDNHSNAVIADMVGMSVAMVERYTRFEDKRQTGARVMTLLAERQKAKEAK